jgi:hypothetical protein
MVAFLSGEDHDQFAFVPEMLHLAGFGGVADAAGLDDPQLAAEIGADLAITARKYRDVLTALAIDAASLATARDVFRQYVGPEAWAEFTTSTTTITDPGTIINMAVGLLVGVVAEADRVVELGKQLAAHRSSEPTAGHDGPSDH